MTLSEIPYQIPEKLSDSITVADKKLMVNEVAMQKLISSYATADRQLIVS